MTTPDGQTYIDAMASAAGFVLDYHRLLAELTGFGDRAEGAEGAQTGKTILLDRRTHEILLALGEAVNCGTEESVARHTRAALGAGATPHEVLDAFEFLPLISGVITFMHAVETWAEVTGAEGVDPTVPYFTMNNDGTPRSSAR